MEQLAVDIFRLTEMIETQVKELSDSSDSGAYDAFTKVRELLEEANHTLASY